MKDFALLNSQTLFLLRSMRATINSSESSAEQFGASRYFTLVCHLQSLKSFMKTVSQLLKTKPQESTAETPINQFSHILFCNRCQKIEI